MSLVCFTMFSENRLTLGKLGFVQLPIKTLKSVNCVDTKHTKQEPHIDSSY